MSAQVAADLRAAADVLEHDGWCQHKFYERSTGARCAVGAINKTTRSLRRREASYSAVMREVGEPWSLTCWNDKIRRTAAEVIAALRAAADRAEAEA